MHVILHVNNSKLKHFDLIPDDLDLDCLANTKNYFPIR